MLVLKISNGPDLGAVFEIQGQRKVLIGRGSTDLTLTDMMISRAHAVLKPRGDAWTLRDLGSRNGTRVNGQRIKDVTVLRDGDQIVTGYTTLEVHVTAGVTDAVTPPKPAPGDGKTKAPKRKKKKRKQREAATPAGTQADASTPAPAPTPAKNNGGGGGGARPGDESEVPASEWMDAVTSQVAKAEREGWDDEDEDAAMTAAAETDTSGDVIVGRVGSVKSSNSTKDDTSAPQHQSA